jgi:hypothetical protein
MTPNVSPRLIQSYGKMPLSFEANQGQTDPKVKFLSRGSGYSLFLTASEAVLKLERASQMTKGPATRDQKSKSPQPPVPQVLRMKLVGANPNPNVRGTDQQEGKSNYFIGNDPKKWRTNVPNYGKVKYEGVYPGVDLVYYGNQQQLEYDFVVAPGAAPAVIRLDLGTAGERRSPLRIAANGDLVINSAGGEVRFQKPVVYQSKSTENHQSSVDNRQLLDGHYLLRPHHRIGFEIASYDHSKPLIIDPVLSYSTLLGGTTLDYGFGVAVDTQGNAYVTGFTFSSDFPTTRGALQTTCSGGCGLASDAFVAKLNPSGSALIYSTYLGGNGIDSGYGIAIDSSGSAYIAGSTDSSDFPTTPGAFQTAFGGTTDGFIAKLNPTGSVLVYSSFLGGTNSDQEYGIAVDPSGNAYVTGFTKSVAFPTTPGAFQTTFDGGFDNATVTKLNPTGSALVYST